PRLPPLGWPAAVTAVLSPGLFLLPGPPARRPRCGAESGGEGVRRRSGGAPASPSGRTPCRPAGGEAAPLGARRRSPASAGGPHRARARWAAGPGGPAPSAGRPGPAAAGAGPRPLCGAARRRRRWGPVGAGGGRRRSRSRRPGADPGRRRSGGERPPDVVEQGPRLFRAVGQRDRPQLGAVLAADVLAQVAGALGEVGGGLGEHREPGPAEQRDRLRADEVPVELVAEDDELGG